MYGPFDSILNQIFPPAARFMVKPQALIRFPEDPANPTDPDGRVSIDSTGGFVLPRLVPLPERTPKAPDFIIVKAGPCYGTDIPIALVEIKRDGGSPSRDLNQMRDYLFLMRQKLADKEARFRDDFRAYLVERELTMVYRLPTHNDSTLTFEDVFVTASDFISNIERLADVYW